LSPASACAVPGQSDQVTFCGCSVNPEVNVSVNEVEGELVYLRPTEGLNEQSVVVIADPETGADRVVTEQRWWRGDPILLWREPGTWTNCRNLLGDIRLMSTANNDGLRFVSTPSGVVAYRVPQ